jgi:hypothetical protein
MASDAGSSTRRRRQAAFGIALAVLGLSVTAAMLLAVRAVREVAWMQREPRYSSSEAGTRAIVARHNPGARLEILGGGNDIPGIPYLRVVIARVTMPGEAASREFDWYFYQVGDGRVLVSESRWPQVTAVGDLIIRWLRPAGPRRRG